MIAFFTHPLTLLLLGGIATLAFKVIYDKWFSSTSRVTMEVFLARNLLVDAALEARNKVVDLKFEQLLHNCVVNQKECSGKIAAKMELNNLLIGKQMEGYSSKLMSGDGMFKSTRHYQRAVIITLLEMCTKLQIDCEKITKAFVDEDLLE